MLFLTVKTIEKKYYKLSKKVFSTVKMTVESDMTVETITQTYVEIFFSTTYVTVEKCVLPLSMVIKH